MFGSPKGYIHFLLVMVVVHTSLLAQGQTDDVERIKQMSLEDLLELEVTSVSKRPEKFVKTSSAIQVITEDDLTNFSASTIPEALSLAGNLQVAQRGSHEWGIISRGFNTELANKMLVLMDGRTLYTPLFSGVFWDRQNYLLEDLNRIEIISGPGGTLWGANAVNGVINIISKSAEETQGTYLEAAAGNQLKGQIAARYGGSLGKGTYFRLYGQYGNREAGIYPDSTSSRDGWSVIQGGFRIDSKKSQSTALTFQGDIYKNSADISEGGKSEVTGLNILGRWSHFFRDSSSLSVQTYLDRTSLTLPTPVFEVGGTFLAPAGVFGDDLITVDLEVQHRVSMHRQNIVWGLGYRFTFDQVSNSPSLGFFPTELKQNQYSFFVQDEIQLIDVLSITLGSKLENNPYVGWIVEPSARIQWRMTEKQLIWSAISRAVRAPSRVDRHISQATPPYFVLLVGGKNFKSEILVSYELGYRADLFNSKVVTSVSLYYNQYDDIRSTILDPDNVFPLRFENGLEADTWGMETSASVQVTKAWRFDLSLFLLNEDVRVKPGFEDFNNAHNETADPKYQILIRSKLQLPYRLRLHSTFRQVAELPINDAGDLRKVPAYCEADCRLSWDASLKTNFSLVGKNLLHRNHVEYGVPGQQVAIPRSIFIQVKVRF